ncbi:MAG TPA: tRNA epoxyqueuosine(34) reductase QueG [Bacteroidales bacterium]|nr:tRNA epoxyqueuosine(34) reductase QueG [Bacteroidales bacterium]
MLTDLKLRSEAIKAEALHLGFDACGIAAAGPLTDERNDLLSWLSAGHHADMGYMERNLEKRTDPQLLVEGARSVIVVLHNYLPPKTSFNSRYKIAKYAHGEDYHIVLKQKLFSLFEYVNKEISPAQGRCFTDSAPVMERTWAVKAGLGWIGKNGNLLTRNLGSYVFIAELIVDIELEYDTPNLRNYCGSCNICIDQCPTGAIVAPKVIDSRKCISYLTIENKNEIPETFRRKIEGWIFGCDICQDVCPWNKKATPTSENKFHPGEKLMSLTDEDWEHISPEDFKAFFKDSPISRAKREGLLRNINICR